MTIPQPMNGQIPSRRLTLFWQAMRRGVIYRLWARLTHRRQRLLDLEQTLGAARVQNQFYSGAQAVKIALIQGTQGKGEDFDAQFNPLRESTRGRWLSVAGQMLRGLTLPPVELIEVDGIYYVRDGHHRISVAHSLGQDYIDAEVIHMRVERDRMENKSIV